jgi:hypothetical protein
MPAAIHIFVGYNVSQSIPKLVETIKTSSSEGFIYFSSGDYGLN